MEHKKEKKFIKLPKYPGGKQAFQEFIHKNLRYPKEALKHKIEGTVYVKYKVDGLGKVIDVAITKGLGYGCDEEAERVVRLLRFEKAKNRGLRVVATMRTRINFKLPDVKIQYQYKTKEKSEKKSGDTKNTKETYGYTITY